MYEQPLTRAHGAPLRLQIPTKIGYKQAKYLTELKVTHVLDKVGYGRSGLLVVLRVVGSGSAGVSPAFVLLAYAVLCRRDSRRDGGATEVQ